MSFVYHMSYTHHVHTLTISDCTNAIPNPNIPVPVPRSRTDVPGPASPLSNAVKMIDAVRLAEVGYCSSVIFGSENVLLGKDDKIDSRCFNFIITAIYRRRLLILEAID